MNTHSLPSRSQQRGAALLWIILAVLALAAVGIFVFQARGQATDVDPSTIYTAEKGELTITVVESGQLKAAKSIDIYSEIRGSTTILDVIDEGTWVQPTDPPTLLVELDAAGLEDDLTSQRIVFENAQAAKIQAEKAVEIQRSTNDSNIRRAQLALDNARDELEKWLDGGEDLEMEKMKEDLTVAEAERERARVEKQNTEQLVEREFAAETELDADKLDLQRSDVRVAQLKREQELKAKYDWKIQKRVLSADVAEAQAELDRANSEAEADLARAVAEANSKRATFELEEGQLELLEDQMSKTKIYAEASGLVVYPTNSRGGRGGNSDRDVIEPGVSVRERQLLLSIPDTSRMIAAISVHESSIDKIKVGQSAVVQVDAMAEGTYYGKVSFVAPLPDSANAWLNPDLKVYRVEIALGAGTEKLKPGMSVSCEVLVDKLDDALSVPVHAVHRQGSTLYCYVQRDGEPEIQEVEVGLANDSRVAITKGLSTGDKVYLAVPQGAPKPEFADDEGVGGVDFDNVHSQTESIQLDSPGRGGREGMGGPREGGEGREGRGGRGEGRGEGRGGREGRGGGRDGSARGPSGGAGGGMGNMSEEQRAAMLQRFQNASPEEQKRMREAAAKAMGQGGGGN